MTLFFKIKNENFYQISNDYENYLKRHLAKIKYGIYSVLQKCDSALFTSNLLSYSKSYRDCP